MILIEKELGDVQLHQEYLQVFLVFYFLLLVVLPHKLFLYGYITIENTYKHKNHYNTMK